jgi:GntR family transcriptional regulator
MNVHLSKTKAGRIAATSDVAPATGLTDAPSPVPLYHRLYVVLRERIVSNTYQAGQPLPSEVELTKQFGVSRITAKRALDELAAEGLVQRARGRGTIVAQRATSGLGGGPIAASMDGLLRNLSAIGRDTSVQLLEFGYAPPPPHVRDLLRLPQDATVQRAVRVRHLAGAPLSQSTSFLLERIGRSFDRDALTSSPLIDLVGRAGVRIGTVNQSITATLADHIVAPRLLVTVGSPLLMMKRLFMDEAGMPVEYMEILYRPDRFEYQMQLSRDQAVGETQTAARRSEARLPARARR